MWHILLINRQGVNINSDQSKFALADFAYVNHGKMHTGCNLIFIWNLNISL